MYQGYNSLQIYGSNYFIDISQATNILMINHKICNIKKKNNVRAYNYILSIWIELKIQL